jgi:hypothetical protein
MEPETAEIELLRLDETLIKLALKIPDIAIALAFNEPEMLKRLVLRLAELLIIELTMFISSVFMVLETLTKLVLVMDEAATMLAFKLPDTLTSELLTEVDAAVIAPFKLEDTLCSAILEFPPETSILLRFADTLISAVFKLADELSSPVLRIPDAAVNAVFRFEEMLINDILRFEENIEMLESNNPEIEIRFVPKAPDVLRSAELRLEDELVSELFKFADPLIKSAFMVAEVALMTALMLLDTLTKFVFIAAELFVMDEPSIAEVLISALFKFDDTLRKVAL